MNLLMKKVMGEEGTGDPDLEVAEEQEVKQHGAEEVRKVPGNKLEEVDLTGWTIVDGGRRGRRRGCQVKAKSRSRVKRYEVKVRFGDPEEGVASRGQVKEPSQVKARSRSQVKRCEVKVRLGELEDGHGVKQYKAEVLESQGNEAVWLTEDCKCKAVLVLFNKHEGEHCSMSD